MLKHIPHGWKTTADVSVFGHAVRVHQSGQAVILEVDGLCIVGDTYPDEKAAGGMVLVFPRLMAMTPTLEDAKKAVEMDGVTSNMENAEAVCAFCGKPLTVVEIDLGYTTCTSCADGE
jgi:hypothetical protein